MTEPRTCRLPHCNNEVQGNRVTCSRACAELWAKVYRYTEDKERTNRNQARYIVRNPDKYSDAHVRWARRQLGENIPLMRTAKLQERDIPTIRSDPRPATEIAADYGVAVVTIRRVKARTTWRHVT